ncbi:MAG: hypothetical protein WD063_21370 [Pirellulales bacterium]
MQRDGSRFKITRRRFAFWVGLGLFSLGEKLGGNRFDALAAATMRATEPSKPSTPQSTPEHWTVADNNTWRWFERENLIDGQWTLSGITTPINKETGEPYALGTGYLDESLVPAEVRRGNVQADARIDADTHFERDHGQPSAARRARHGRPPSRWLRSLNADEIRVWLKTIEVPEADVSGMTFWTHLTRDHSFDPEKIEGLTIPQQARLHAAAHYGY